MRLLRKPSGIVFALLNAVLYALCMPFSQLLLKHVHPLFLSALLYGGVVVGMGLIKAIQRMARVQEHEQKLGREDVPYIAAVIPCGICATVLLMSGIEHASAANASLLNNFEIVSTGILAMLLFKERISRRLWIAIILVTIASIILSFKDTSSLSFSFGSVLVLGSCVCWGFENNLTRRLSGKDPVEVVIVKALGAGAFAAVIAFCAGEHIPEMKYVLLSLLLGFVSYGLSNFCYINAQRTLGAAKAAAFYAVSPFVGTVLSLVLFRTMPSQTFIVAFPIMAAGAYLAATDKK